jgi:hypothetical protein
LKTHKDAHSTFSVSVDCHDDSSFESGDMSLFADNSPLLIKRLEYIEISASGSKPAEWNLVAKFEREKGSIKITSNDGVWVNGLLAKYQDLVSSFKPQNTFVKKYSFLIWILTTAACAYTIGSIAVKLGLMPSPTGDLSDKIFYTIPDLMLGGLFAYTFIIILRHLWPSVELAIGPEHTQIEKRIRSGLGLFCILVIIPMATNFIYDLIKYFASYQK